MMAMSMMMGGKNTGSPFEGMFDFDLDFNGDDEEEDDEKTNKKVKVKKEE